MTERLSVLVDFLYFIILAVFYYLETLLKALTPVAFRKKAVFENKVVLITGGAGGVGRRLAVKFAKRNAIVVLWDINEKILINVKNHLNSRGYKQIHVYHVDISERTEVYKFSKIVIATFGPVDYLINNAAVTYGDVLLNLPDSEIERVFKVNIFAHYWTTKAFLPTMMEQKSGHIVTIASMAGLLGVYKCTDYSATKFATIGFHESLYIELKALGYDNINMTLICPYIINTDLFHGVEPRLMPPLDADFVADKIVRSVELNEAVCIIPSFSRFLMPLKFLMPAKLCWELINRLERGPQSMQLMTIKKNID